MGYETKLVVGMPYTHIDRDGGIYFMVYAEVDMCKMGYDANISKLDWKNTSTSPEPYWYYFRGESEDKVIEDKYGDKSRPVPIGEVIEALEQDVARDDYSRFKWALDLLKSMDDSKGYAGLSVMFYGY